MANRHFRVGEQVRLPDGSTAAVIRPEHTDEAFEYFQMHNSLLAIYTVVDLHTGEVRRYSHEALQAVDPRVTGLSATVPTMRSRRSMWKEQTSA